MEIHSLTRTVRASDVPMEKLAGNKSISEEDKVAEISRQFEAVLLRQILTEAHKTHFKTKFTDNGATSEIYRDMVTTQLADSISKTGSFGLAQSLRQQLTHELPSKTEGTK